MARKSRKNAEAAVTPQSAVKIYDVGMYVRLSAVDRKHKGDSIENQQAVIAAYIAEHPDLALRETYIDNGTSGQTFDRPAFRRMLADFESGKINACVTKDLSRLGRNAIDTGYYIEKYFPAHGIRYIAVNDSYDSNDGSGGGTLVSLKNMVNEHYALEVGRKNRATKQMNARNGAYIGSTQPYGYMKDPGDCHRLLVDPEAAEIVKTMFAMIAAGCSTRAVFDWLNGSGILPPLRYFAAKGLPHKKTERVQERWDRGTVLSLLRNRIYCGDMVQGKSVTVNRECKRLPESEWIVTENTHEALVSRGLFAQVQEKLSVPRTVGKSRFDTPAAENIFLRKIFCGECGYAMSRTRQYLARKKKDAYIFVCETNSKRGKGACAVVRIDEEELKTRLLTVLNKQAEVFADKLAAVKPPDKDSAELQQVQQELARNGGFLKGLYESLVLGDITKDEYTEMKQGYETRIAALTEREQRLTGERRERFLRETAMKKAVGELGTVNAISDLTAEVIDTLIERILVFEDKHIEVHFRFDSGLEGKTDER